MKRILVVEDEAPVRLLIEKILTMAGYEVVSAQDGKHALVAARDKQFSAPIIVLSGRVRDTDVKAALDAGADAFLSKPVNREDLLAKISELMPPAAPGS